MFTVPTETRGPIEPDSGRAADARAEKAPAVSAPGDSAASALLRGCARQFGFNLSLLFEEWPKDSKTSGRLGSRMRPALGEEGCRYKAVMNPEGHH